MSSDGTVTENIGNGEQKATSDLIHKKRPGKCPAVIQIGYFRGGETCLATLAITYFTVWLNGAEVLPVRDGPPL